MFPPSPKAFRCDRFIVLGILLAGLAFWENQSVSAEKPVDGTSRALLVGCTKYDFNESRSLKGPGNDVALMFDLLVERFGYSPVRIRRLVEGRSAEERPTRKNIVREIEALI